MAANRTVHGPRGQTIQRHADERSFDSVEVVACESLRGLRYDLIATGYNLTASNPPLMLFGNQPVQRALPVFR